MGTKQTNSEEFLKLWEKFDYLLKKQKLTLNKFSKNWDRFDDNSFKDGYTAGKFKDKLKQIQRRYNRVKNKQQNSVHDESLIQLREYIKFLSKGHITQELHPSETWENLFS